MGETKFVEETFRFMFAGIIPVFVVPTIFTLVFRFSKNNLNLLIVSTVFGSLAFLDIPFITFAFPTTQGESLATLSAATIAIVSVTISITVLELYKLEKSTKGSKHVAKRLSKNPLIISILSGILLCLVGIEIPSPLSTSLHMLGARASGTFLRECVVLKQILKGVVSYLVVEKLMEMPFSFRVKMGQQEIEIS